LILFTNIEPLRGSQNFIFLVQRVETRCYNILLLRSNLENFQEPIRHSPLIIHYSRLTSDDSRHCPTLLFLPSSSITLLNLVCASVFNSILMLWSTMLWNVA